MPHIAQGRPHSWVLQTLIFCFVAIIALLPFHAFLSTWGGTAIGPLLVWKSWKEILLIALLPLIIFYLVQRPDIVKTLIKSRLMQLIALYFGANVAAAVFSQASYEAVAAGLMMNLRFFAICVLGYILYLSGHPWVERIKSKLPAWFFSVTIVVSLLAILQVTVMPVDFLTHFGYGKDTIPAFLTLDDNPNALRAYATLRGPNPFGSFLLLPFALALITVFRERRNVLAGVALGLSGFALVLTSSRSAWLGAVVALAVLAVALVPRQKLIKAIKLWTVPALALVGLFFWMAVTFAPLRLAVFHSSPSDPHLLEGSSQIHLDEIVRGIQDVNASPAMLGYGVGTAGPASFYNQNANPKIAESYFIQIAQEMGWVILALFLAISAIVASKLWKQRPAAIPVALFASFIGINAINIFLHGWADDPTSMTWWGIAGLYLWSDNKA